MKSIEQIVNEIATRYENDEYQGDELSMVRQAVRDSLQMQRDSMLADLDAAFGTVEA